MSDRALTSPTMGDVWAVSRVSLATLLVLFGPAAYAALGFWLETQTGISFIPDLGLWTLGVLLLPGILGLILLRLNYMLILAVPPYCALMGPALFYGILFVACLDSSAACL
ncbi:hypothetical protein [Stakelama tenebrarum]|uniref:Uncharacterized protein n=1 Tax=Stakelama tenebrarum TaxID=2711215 RepID=A0A6G6Y884_9SPHN|nr:hypothetical protein [Sphingosinithalassobacter tenebrarum]QIG81152.1 hypothetical protein G5C33_16125 [Sphingosinithalassobacter tenebrarum]